MKTFIFFLLLVLFPLIVFSDAAVQSIGIQKDKDGYLVVFKSQGKATLLYTSSILHDPPRIILDFPGMESDLSDHLMEIKDNPLISLIKTGDKLEPGKKSFHVEIDLKKDVQFSLSPSSSGFVLRVTPQETKQPTDLSKKDSANTKRSDPHPSVSNKRSSGSNTGSTSVNPSNPPTSENPPISVPPPTGRTPDIVEPRLDIGAEDLLEITVFELPQFNTVARVSGDGTVTMPLIGSVTVGGLTRQEAESKIRSALEAKYVNNANVSVNIKEYKSKQIGIFGAVKNPGAMYILSHRTLLQVITDAGGLTPDAAPKCFIFRADGTRLEIDLADLINTGDPKWNVPVYPGDFINIPTGGKIVIYVLGEVRNPGPVDITFGTPMTILTAIAKAGGLSANASKSGIQIRRTNAKGEIELVKVNIKDILKGKKPDMALEPGDVINVPQSFF